MRGASTISCYIKYFALLLAALTLLNSPVRAEVNCEELWATRAVIEMKRCVQSQFEASEKALKATLDRVSKNLDDKQKKALNKAQLAWTRYRLLDCHTYSLKTKGQFRPIYNTLCRSKLTNQRNAVLIEQYQ